MFSADRAEFDLVAKLWTIPGERTKNGSPHLAPLAPAALRVLRRIPASDASGKLFPARRRAITAENGASGFSKAQARLRAALPDAEHWTFHDLRRTVATGLQRLGARFEVTEAILNHVGGSPGGIAGVYQRHDWMAEKRTEMRKWALFLDKAARQKSAVS